jgi:exodeoxyribonuclease V beta subunit
MTTVARPSSLPSPADRFVVVEASAGTGKTYFLEHRVVDLILAGAELGQLLLVTFTEKAVAELRMRIRDLLDRLSRVEVDVPGDSVWEIDDAAKRRLRAAVTAFDHAPIFTIHGFCHRILVEDAFAARRLFEQTQVADEVAFDAAFGVLLREQFARVPADRDLLSAFLQTNRTIEHLRDLLLKCARADAPLRRQLDPTAARKAVADLYASLGAGDQRDDVLVAIKGTRERDYVGSRLADVGIALALRTPDAPTPELLAMVESVRKPMTELYERLQDLRRSNRSRWCCRPARSTRRSPQRSCRRSSRGSPPTSPSSASSTTTTCWSSSGKRCATTAAVPSSPRASARACRGR